MAFLCPVRIPRRRRKRRDGDNPTKNGTPKGRITGSNSVDSLVALEKENDDEEVEFEPRKMVVLHDFIPCVEDEVPVNRGEHVKALYQETDWIYIIKLDNEEGFIPFTYCVSEEEYEKRKEKQKNTSIYRKDFLKSPLHDAMVTQESFEPAEFPKQNYGEFFVKFDFDATDEDDVSVRKGEIVQVLNKEDQDWYWVKKSSGKEGFIPKTFLSKLEQTAPSRSLVNRGPISRSNPNIYTSAKMSPHPAFIATSSSTSFSRIDQQQLTKTTRVLPLSNRGSMDYSSTSGTTSSKSSSQTPVISADQSLSTSRTEENLPYSNEIQGTPVFVSLTRNTPGGKTNRPFFSKVPYGIENVLSSTPQLGHTTTVSNVSRATTASTLLITDENHNLKLHNPNICKPFSSMSKIDQRHNFSSDSLETHPLSHSLGRSYDHQSRRNSNEFLLYGQELVCIDTHIGRKVDELTVYKGDWIYADMKYRDGRGWVWAYSPATKNQGFVPKACLRPPATTPL